MALQQTHVIDLIEVLQNGIIQVRQNNQIIDDSTNAVLASTYHRWSLFPSQDLTGQDPKVVAIATATWTSEVIADYQESIKQPTNILPKGA
jgi:hypothetical protein